MKLHANIHSATDSAAKGEEMARRRIQNPDPYMNKNKTLWKATIAEYSRDSNGVERRKRRELTLGRTATMTKRQAMRTLKPYLDKANDSAFAPTDEEKTITFEKFSDVWLKDYLSLSKPSTQATMKGHVKRLREFFGPMPMRQIGAADLQGLVSKLVAEDYNPKTIRNFWITTKLILDAATSHGYRESLLSKPKLPRPQKTPAACFSLADVAGLINESSGDGWFGVWWLLAETGIRCGELLGLTPEDVKSDCIIVNKTVWNGKTGSTKSDNSVRKIAISPRLAAWLFEYKAVLKNYGKLDRFLYPSFSDRQKPMDPNYFREILASSIHNLKIKPGGCWQSLNCAGLHAFRHFNASLMDSLRIPLKVRQERLGHASMGSLTLDVYTHATWTDNVEAAKQLSDAIYAEVLHTDREQYAGDFDELTAVDKKRLPTGVSEALVA